ncbi:hypothetical protein UA08_02906 [Talaromyces atroroseus]|uniref:Uncharacterized protein n=1 Tax=Talaromyces atroroseus TaxID=1441469 RepID=A0A225AYM8_TALAT|nr:hypothetical protein UA08_02906 [Talaromyces atroroseus]OKL62458.1 hypothetical protein UA08_02906 [Talaromyces atroroseus]
MAATKGKKVANGGPGGAQSHIRARLAYLHKAALYLQTATKESQTTTNDNNNDDNENESSIQARTHRHYINQMRGISRKTQQRLSIETKRSFCKRCDLLLIPGVTSTEEVENQSKDQKKPWADVLVVRCKACEAVKRFPQNQKRSAKLSVRKQERGDKDAELKNGSGGS